MVDRSVSDPSPASSSPILEVIDVSKSFNSTHVVRNLHLTAQPGEKLALIGSSGSGKTTILRIVMTLERPDSGMVIVDGEALWHRQTADGLIAADEAHLRRMRRKIGMVFQQFNLFPHMTVLQNVAEPPVLALGMGKEEAEASAIALLGRVGLKDKLSAYPSQLSGGQKQRVAIARALAMRPKIMLFDEVTSALDPELVEEVLNVLHDLASEGDMTMILVTHEMSFARSIADRVLFFDCGRVLEEGPPNQIFSDPKEERTRMFLRKIIAAGHSL